MQTLSIHITEIEEKDDTLCFYDDLSLIIVQIMKELNLFGVKLINITDYYGDKTESSIKKITNLYSDNNDTLLVSAVEINPMEFSPDLVCTEEVAGEIQKALLRDEKMFKRLGFKEIYNEYYKIPNTTIFIYPNHVGNKIIEFIDS